MIFTNAALEELSNIPPPLRSRSSSPKTPEEEKPSEEEATPPPTPPLPVISLQVCPYCERDFCVAEFFDENFLRTEAWPRTLEDVRMNTPGGLSSRQIRKHLYRHFVMNGYWNTRTGGTRIRLPTCAERLIRGRYPAELGVYVGFHARNNMNKVNAVDGQGIRVEKRFWVNSVVAGIRSWILMGENDERVYDDDEVAHIIE